MEVSSELLEGNRAKVTVTFDKDAVNAEISKQYKEFANHYAFPGFRKGKAPRPVINNMLGKEAVLGMATDRIVNDSFNAAVNESGLMTLGEPTFDEEAMGLIVENEPFTYIFEIEVTPEFELNSYEPVEIEMPAEEATEEEVNREIELLTARYNEIVDAPANTKIKPENYAMLNIAATDDNGEDIATISSEARQYALDSRVLPKEFDEQILGMKKGENKQFTIDVPVEPTALTADLAGKTQKINFDVTVNVVQKEVAPKLTDEWVKENFGLETVDEFKKEIADGINSQKQAFGPRMKEWRALEALAERLEGEASEAFLTQTEENLLRDFFIQLQTQGATFDMYLQQMQLTPQEFRAQIQEQAQGVCVQELAVDAWARHFDITVSEEEVLQEIKAAGVEDAEATAKQMLEEGRLPQLRSGILRKKATDDIVEKAVVKPETAKDEKAADAE